MRSFYNEGHVNIGDGEQLHLVLDFRAIDIIESLTGQSMDQILPQLASPTHSLVTKVLWAMLREKHEGVTLDQAMGVVVDPKYGAAAGLVVGDLLRRAYNLGEAKDKNPPKRRGRSKTS